MSGILDIVGDILGNNNAQGAISSANKTQTNAYTQALNLAGAEYANTAQNELPYLTTGTSAESQLAQMYGLANGGTVTAAGTVGGVNAGADLSPNAGNPSSQSTKSFGGVSEGGLDQAQDQSLLTSRPDVQNGYNQLSSQTQGYFGNNVDNYANYWYNKYGQSEGYTPSNAVGQTASSTATGTPTATGSSTSGATYTNAAGGASNVDPNASFYLSPDYNFALQQGLNGVQASAAANGMSDSGAARKAEIAYSSGLATQDYQNYANTLKGLASSGQSAGMLSALNNQNYTTAATSDITTPANDQANNSLLSASVSNSYLSNLLGSIQGIGSNLQSSFNSSSGLTPSSFLSSLSI